MTLDLSSINWSHFTFNLLLGYAISWIYFFATLPYFKEILGKTRGYFIGYLSSWIVWFVASYIIDGKLDILVDDLSILKNN